MYGNDMYGSEWDYYTADGGQVGPAYQGYGMDPAEMYGYQYGNVADAWNSHAAQSDYYLDQAAGYTNDGRGALYDAAANLGTNPGAVDHYLTQAANDFYATDQAMWQSMGYDGMLQF